MLTFHVLYQHCFLVDMFCFRGYGLPTSGSSGHTFSARVTLLSENVRCGLSVHSQLCEEVWLLTSMLAAAVDPDSNQGDIEFLHACWQMPKDRQWDLLLFQPFSCPGC